jgi:hypothetical protein
MDSQGNYIPDSDAGFSNASGVRHSSGANSPPTARTMCLMLKDEMCLASPPEFQSGMRQAEHTERYVVTFPSHSLPRAMQAE